MKVTAQREMATGTSVQSRYYISSLASQAKTLLEAARTPLGYRKQLALVLGRYLSRRCTVVCRKDHGPQNLAVLRQIALNMLKHRNHFKRGIQGKRLKAGWVEDYLLEVLLG